MKKIIILAIAMFVSVAAFAQKKKGKVGVGSLIYNTSSDWKGGAILGSGLTLPKKDSSMIEYIKGYKEPYMTIGSWHVASRFLARDSTGREVASVDSTGTLTVIDSLATIKVMLRSYNIKVK